MGGTLLTLQKELRKEREQWHSRGKAVGRRKRSNYCINYLISIHLQDPLACTNHFKNAAKCSILTHLPWQEEECGSRRGWRNEIYRQIKATNAIRLAKEAAQRGHQGRKLREVTFFSFFVKSTCSLLKCWQCTVAKCRWIEAVFPDIPEYRNPWCVVSLPPPSSFSEIRAQVKFSSNA